MNSPKYVKIIPSFCLLIIGLWCIVLQPQKLEAASNTTIPTGRDNPFAKLPKKKAASQKMSQASQSNEETTEFFLETIALEFLDAKSLTSVVRGMLSDNGSASNDVKTNSLIIWDTKESLEKIIAQIQEADKTAIPRQAIIEIPRPELFVETVTLKFLDAKNLEPVIKNMSSDYGSISIDEKSNSLIVCDTKENLEMILDEIGKADKTPQQIMVEVVILDVRLDDDSEIGINWDLLSDKNYDIGYRQNFTLTRLGSTVENATTIGDATAFNTTGLGGDFSVISGTIRNVVHMIQQKRSVEILASPRVMMVSGQTGYVEAIEELPYTEITDSAAGGMNALTSTDFKPVGVRLTVSATLTEDSGIFLTVEAEQNAAVGESDTEIPIIDTRKAKTSLLLKDSQVVILGGLRRQSKTEEIDQIPIIGDLPIIGELFKNTKAIVKNSELVVFLSPHIYKDEVIPDDKKAKYDEITGRPMLSLPD
ncbi:MAG: secretin N-terminal domain-containing protein [Planctomycetota bacterium]